ncbi:MAG: transposase [Treponema sp.]|nr:transposase [Treponema sp.]
MKEEFTGPDCNSSRLEKRFVRTMETLSKQPDKSIWFSSENRAEASETKFPQPYIGCRITRS